jgi:hypothetical protein
VKLVNVVEPMQSNHLCTVTGLGQVGSQAQRSLQVGRKEKIIFAVDEITVTPIAENFKLATNYHPKEPNHADLAPARGQSNR